MQTASQLCADLACVHCEYNLRSQPIDGLCPECGKPVADSLGPPLFEAAGRPWRIRFAIGLWLLVIAWPLMLAVTTELLIGSGVGTCRAWLVAAIIFDDQFGIRHAAFSVLSLMADAAGYWLVTTRGPSRFRSEAGLLPTLVRWTGLILPLCGIAASVGLSRDLFPLRSSLVAMRVIGCMGLLTIIGVVFLFLLLARRAREIEAANLKRACLVAGFGQAGGIFVAIVLFVIHEPIRDLWAYMTTFLLNIPAAIALGVVISFQRKLWDVGKRVPAGA